MKRSMPGHKKRLVSVVINDRKVSDVIRALEAYADRHGSPRAYVNADGDLVIAVDNWQV